MSTINITSAKLDSDRRKIRLTLATPIPSGEVGRVSYTKGTVQSADGGILESFIEKAIANKVVTSTKQKWASYPISPVLTSEYPYQTIVRTSSGMSFLVVSKYKLYDDYTDVYITNLKREIQVYAYDLGLWLITGTTDRQSFASILEANNDVFTDQNYTTVRFVKSTS